MDPKLVEVVASLRGDLDHLSASLHGTPETAFEEFHAAKTLTGWLEAEDFAVTRGVGGLETAFVARHNGARPGPNIAILLEYDALPAIGHGCGHNLIASGGATAAAAIARRWPDHAGTLLVIGTPGEEGGGGKILLLDAGVFDEVDAALMFHPADRGLVARHGLACAHLRFTFHGRAAHAAKNPTQGRSALAAAQLFMIATDMMRQFIPDTARLHGIITHGGDAPNVVPERAETTFRVRDTTSASLQDLLERVLAAARGAAIATECEVEVEKTAPVYEERVNNLTIAGHLASHLRTLGIELEDPSADNPAGSSDIGNVSTRLPTIHPYLQIAVRDTPGHSAAMREASASPHAHDQVQAMAAALAQTTADLLDDPDLLEAARDEFEANVGTARTDTTTGGTTAGGGSADGRR